MKSNAPLITAACIAAIALCVPAIAPAKEKKSPSPSPTASASSTEKEKARAIPYRGKITSVDTTAKTFTVGTRTIKVTDETKIMKQGAAATMADIVADEEVRGSYWKKEDGTLEAKSVKLGAKAEAKSKHGAKSESEGASPSASPSVSP